MRYEGYGPGGEALIIETEMPERRLQQCLGAVGPAGLLLADDTEMYERNQRGINVRRPEWVFLGRGTHRERRDEDGYRIGHSTDEVPSRGIWRHYRGLMEAAR